jgi:hypothetical protein
VSATDPVGTVWAALESHGWRPHGQSWDFRAACPAHDGENRDALHVKVGADGQAVLWCFARRCAVEDIVRAIGLDMRDLFPAGHRRSRRRKLPAAHRTDFAARARSIANVLLALQELRADWYLQLRADCAHCGAAGALLQASPDFLVFVCPGDEHATDLGYGACTFEQFEQALAGKIEDRRQAA